jgi:PhnB protein
MTQNSNTRVEAYLFLEGRCEEAIEFYKKAIGAETVFMMRFKESPDQQGCPVPPGNENKIMHATLRVGGSQLMCSDGRCSGKSNVEGIALSISAADEKQARAWFDALGAGGQVIMPMGKTFYSPA